MTIDIKTLTGRTIAGSGTATRARSGASSGSAKSTAGDSVTLTGIAAQLTQLTDMIHSLPVVDQSRVADVHLEVINGNYTVDVPVTAYKFVVFESALDRE